MREVEDWKGYKNILRGRSTQAKRAITDLKMRNFVDKTRNQMEQSSAIKEIHYNGLGLEKAKRVDPLEYLKKMSVKRKQSNEAQKEKSSPRPAQDPEVLSISAQQKRLNALLGHLFRYWCKKKTSKYLRMQDF